MTDLNKERKLYNKLVDTLIDKLDEGKNLALAIEFLKNQGIGAEPTKHKGLKELTGKALDMPFDEDEQLPLKRIK